jgi:hypothetical protein
MQSNVGFGSISGLTACINQVRFTSRPDVVRPVTHMNFGSTLVHNASVDFINLPCGTSAL